MLTLVLCKADQGLLMANPSTPDVLLQHLRGRSPGAQAARALRGWAGRTKKVRAPGCSRSAEPGTRGSGASGGGWAKGVLKMSKVLKGARTSSRSSAVRQQRHKRCAVYARTSTFANAEGVACSVCRIAWNRQPVRRTDARTRPD